MDEMHDELHVHTIGQITRRVLPAREIARLVVAHYWPLRHAGHGLREACRKAIREARDA